MDKTCRVFTLALAAASLTFTLTACGNADSANQSNSASTADTQSAFPVTIKHAFGETTITKTPQRIASIGWANHEVPSPSAKPQSESAKPHSAMTTTTAFFLGSKKS